MRKLSKKNSRLKFRMEVETVKRNIEKRDEIWKDHKLNDLWKFAKHTEKHYVKVKNAETDFQKGHHIKSIQDR